MNNGTENISPVERIVVVSDLHLGSGRDDAWASSNHLELFHHDAAFARFVEHLSLQSESSRRRLRLVILGDLLDFPRVPETGGTPAKTDADLVDRTRRVVAGHSLIFDALRAFAERGHLIDILPGNHDVGMIRPVVQDEIRSAVDTTETGRLRFHSWIFHIPGLLYAEHGHQYHDINSFQRWLDASRSPLTKIHWPIGAKFDEYFIDLLMHLMSKSDTWPKSFPGVIAALIRNPGSLVQTVPLHLRFMSDLIPALLFSKSYRRAGSREAYRSTMAGDAQAEIGISENALCEVDKVAEQLATNLGHRLARGVLILMLSKFSLNRSRASDADQLGLPSTADQRLKLLQRVAGEIDTILAGSGQNVPFYVFGHTHLPDNASIRMNQREFKCLNAGSWLNQVLPSGDSVTATNGFTFVLIERSANDGTPNAHLLAWNDVTRSIVTP